MDGAQQSRIEGATTREFDQPRSVSLTVVGGRVDVVAAPMTHTARLEVHEISGPPLTVSWSAGELKLEQLRDTDGQMWGALKSLFGGVGSERTQVRLTLAVPDDTNVSVKSVSADVLVGGSHGRVGVYSVSGEVTLDRTTGGVDVSTVSGDVESSSPAGELKAKTVSGDITVHDAVLRSARLNTVSGDAILDVRHGPSLVTTNSVSGEVSIRMPAGCGYDATVASSSGHVIVDGEPLIKDGKRGGHRYTGDRGVAIKARTVTGDVVVLRRDSTPEGPAAGPVIGDQRARSDIQDEVKRPHEGTGHSPGTNPR